MSAIELLVKIDREYEKDFVQLVKKFIYTNVCDPAFDVNALADHFSISVEEMHARYFELTAETICDRIRKCRLKRASEILVMTNDSVKNVSLSCGFSNYSSFWKAFLKEYHCSPSIYRNVTVAPAGFLYEWKWPYDYSGDAAFFHVLKSNDWVAQLFQIMIERMADNTLAIDDISAELCWSNSHLIRKLKQTLNVTPKKLLLHLRLLFASDLLGDPSFTVAQVAYLTGFFDQSHFCRSFKQNFKCSATEFRKSEIATDYLSHLQKLLDRVFDTSNVTIEALSSSILES